MTATKLTPDEKAEQERRQDQLNDICAVLATGQGRRFIWRLLEKAHLFQTSYAGATNATFFNEGERNVGLWVYLELMEANPELVLLMQQESKEE